MYKWFQTWNLVNAPFNHFHATLSWNVWKYRLPGEIHLSREKRQKKRVSHTINLDRTLNGLRWSRWKEKNIKGFFCCIVPLTHIWKNTFSFVCGIKARWRAKSLYFTHTYFQIIENLRIFRNLKEFKFRLQVYFV